jgi:hypothetical protein
MSLSARTTQLFIRDAKRRSVPGFEAHGASHRLGDEFEVIRVERQAVLIFLTRTTDDAKRKHGRLLSSYPHLVSIRETKVQSVLNRPGFPGEFLR